MDISSFLRLGVSAVEGKNEYITFEAIKKHFENYTEDAQNFGQSILDLYKNGDDFGSSASVSNRIERTTQFYSYISNYNNGPRFLYIDFDIYFIELISGSGKSYSNIKIYFPTSTTLCLKISFTNTDHQGSFKSIGTFKSAEIESIMPGKRHLFSSDYFPTDVATIDEIKEYIDSLSNDNRYYNIVQPIVDLYENYGITELYSTGTKLNSNGSDYPGAKDIIFFIDVSNDYEDQGAGTIFYNNYLCLTIYDPKEPNRVLKTKFVKENESYFELGKMSYEIVEYSTIGQEKYDTVTLTDDHQGTGILPPSISKGYRAVYEYYNSTDSEITFYVSREDGTVSDISVTVASGESVFLQFIKGYNDKLYVNRLYLDSLS